VTPAVSLITKGLQPIFTITQSQGVSIRFWCHPPLKRYIRGEDDTEFGQELEVGSWKLEVGSWKSG
jgi:hypothetical protein